MHIEKVSENTLFDAAAVHAAAWRESHREICSEAFIAEHTTQRQMNYILNAMSLGRKFFMLTDIVPVAVVSVEGNVIADLYVHPERQRRGYGTTLLNFALSQCNGLPTLWVLNSNTNAQRLYERVGFVKSGQIKGLKNNLYEVEMIYQKG